MQHNGRSGHYNATLNGIVLPRTDAGYIWEITHEGETVQFEEFGDHVLDLLYRGATVTLEAVYKEWLPSLTALIWPFSTTFGKIDCPAGQFAQGQLVTPTAVPLILTAETCSPAGQAGADGPASITFHRVVMDLDVAARVNLDNNLRMVPVRLRALLEDIDPSTATTDYRYFSVA